MHPSCSLHNDDSSKKVDQKVHRGMVGFRLYLIAYRPYIMFGLCTGFHYDPKESHLRAVKRIFTYVKGTTNLGMCYKSSSKYRYVDFCDADYAEDKLERKITSGNCTFFGENLITQLSKRQMIIAISTPEAEYILAASCSTKLLWMKYQLKDFKINESNILIFYDNISAICLTKNTIL
ncbi:secreted RxLR effector protein 161-like [Cicer arietinum]|uniref:secreted RxLR effector protein 161-like n=1 Tax=Cicer arietinum TaxID=3827 RepID=UPI003CC6B96C